MPHKFACVVLMYSVHVGDPLEREPNNTDIPQFSLEVYKNLHVECEDG